MKLKKYSTSHTTEYSGEHQITGLQGQLTLRGRGIVTHFRISCGPGNEIVGAGITQLQALAHLAQALAAAATEKQPHDQLNQIGEW